MANWVDGTAVPWAFALRLYFSPIMADNTVYVIDRGTNFYKYNLSTKVWTQLTSPTYNLNVAGTLDRSLALSPDGTKLACIGEGTANYRGGKRIEVYTIATNTWAISGQVQDMDDEVPTSMGTVISGLVWADESIIWCWATEATTSVKNYARCIKYTVGGAFTIYAALLNGALTHAAGYSAAINVAGTIIYGSAIGATIREWQKYTIAGDSYATGGTLTPGRFFALVTERDKLWYVTSADYRPGYIDSADDSENDNKFVENTERTASYGNYFGVKGDLTAIIAHAKSVSPWIMSLSSGVATAAPSVTTQAASDIAETTATGNGNVTSLGIPVATQHGHCWATFSNPTTTHDKTTKGAPSSTGAFTSNLTGLIPYTKYYVRAYITNSVGTFYGAEVTLITLADVPVVATDPVEFIAATTVLGHGAIINGGGSDVTQHGVCWSTSANPTTADDKTEEGATILIGEFFSLLTGLVAGVTYHIRAYAINSSGTGYGIDVTFITQVSGAPIVTTQDATGIQRTSLIGNGTIADVGAGAITQHGHCWATTVNPTTSDFKTAKGVSLVGAFASSIIGLVAGTAYYIRAYATNSYGTSYGNNILIAPRDGTRGSIAVKGEFIVYASKSGAQRALLGEVF